MSINFAFINAKFTISHVHKSKEESYYITCPEMNEMSSEYSNFIGNPYSSPLNQKKKVTISISHVHKCEIKRMKVVPF
jgi:helix-turn-helix protein